MRVSYSDGPLVVTKPSIFLAGPTPRSKDVKSWRPEAIEHLEDFKFPGQVIVPEKSDWTDTSYVNQVEWEYIGLEECSLVVFWVPRDLETMPALTTNVEFGGYVKSGRILYGRPDYAPKNQYLDWLYTKHTYKIPSTTLYSLLALAVMEMGIMEIKRNG